MRAFLVIAAIAFLAGAAAGAAFFGLEQITPAEVRRGR